MFRKSIVDEAAERSLPESMQHHKNKFFSPTESPEY